MGRAHEFLELVGRLSSAEINRSENDLSSNLKNAFTEFGVTGVLDTGAGSNHRKRPDIALYADLASAELGIAAEVVIESKKPAELSAFTSLTAALVQDNLWYDKFVPYVQAHAVRVQYFMLTTFEQLLVVPITTSLRRLVLENALATPEARYTAIQDSFDFDLRKDGGKDWLSWVESHLTPDALIPPPLSTILDVRVLGGADDLDSLASDLADLVVGPEGGATHSTVLASASLDAHEIGELPPAARSALMVFTMSAHGGMSAQAANEHLQTHFAEELEGFVSASIHSLIGRLFAVKTIEDSFCIDVDPPLIPEAAWVFHSDQFDNTPPELLPASFFAALARLGQSENLAVRDLAATGRFYDWLAPLVDPTIFRRLLELFFSNSFAVLDGDLLGRFFEIYAQRVDRRKRRELGQYYTPMPIVRYMWRVAMQIALEKSPASELLVLDPSVGSGTFLIEGARQLKAAGLTKFWESLNGFDIAPQVIGVAQVNLYLAALGLLDRKEADQVGTLNLYPTDALDPRNGAHLRSLLHLFVDEGVKSFLLKRIELSEKVKQQSRFPLIIGNPPYKHNSNRTLRQMAEEFPPLLRSSTLNARAQENAIREDYAWFFAAADHYLRDQGLIAFVVSDSFCYGPSFRYFREDILRRYRVRKLVHLGRFIFRDVGPRTSFVIIVLERLTENLETAEEADPIQYVDLRPLITGEDRLLGTEADPRFAVLISGELGDFAPHQPTRNRQFNFLPAREVVSLVLRAPVGMIDAPRRVFVKKWPGVVTGFDKLLKNADRAVIADRLQRVFRAAAGGSRAEQILDGIAQDIRANEAERGKLDAVVQCIVDNALVFDDGKFVQAITGSAPRASAWYPDARMTKWIYYEPAFTFERAVHDGRMAGWGTSNQWRDAASHGISPKLVFTTSTNPEAGLKAFVLTERWLVLKAAGTRQQLNYTGVTIPSDGGLFGGSLNLGREAQSLFRRLEQEGLNEEDFLLYVAAIYNSSTANEYLIGGGSNSMNIPLDHDKMDMDVVLSLVDDARTMRDLTRLGILAESGTILEETEFSDESRHRMAELGFERQAATGGRFRQDIRWTAGADTQVRISERRAVLQAKLDAAVSSIYAGLESANEEA